MRAIVILLSALTLSACDLSSLEGKPSEYQKYHERLEALEAQVAELSRPDEPILLATVPVVEPDKEPIPEPCFEEFRVRRCGPEGEMPW